MAVRLIRAAMVDVDQVRIREPEPEWFGRPHLPTGGRDERG